MHILIDPSTFTCDNMGDVAMLNVAVARIRTLLPGARIQVLTSNPDALLLQQPDVEPVLQNGREHWSADRYFLGRVHNAIPQSVSRGLCRVRRGLRCGWPLVENALVRAKLRHTGQNGESFDAYCRAIRTANVLVISGAATISDTMPRHSRMVFDAIERALSYGLPVAMFSQGIGPLTKDLAARASQLLPRVDLIALREPFSYPLLRRLGVDPERIAVTGDDAIELAYNERSRTLGSGIGVNGRSASYTGISDGSLAVLRRSLHRTARALQCPLIPLPTANHSAAHDSRTISEMLDNCEMAEDLIDLCSPREVIRQAGRCRIVVTGAYHVAVFALAQGIPAVYLGRTEYTWNKCRGLAEQFGGGCTWVDTEAPALDQRLTDAIEAAWSSSSVVRNALIAAAESQIRAGADVYARWASRFLTAQPAQESGSNRLASAAPVR